MKTTEQWLEEGYELVKPGEEREGDVVIVGTTLLPVAVMPGFKDLGARADCAGLMHVNNWRNLGCPVLRKREPLVWEGVVYVNEYGRMMPASCGVMPQEFSRKRVRIEEKL